jgi:hypothetical protein
LCPGYVKITNGDHVDGQGGDDAALAQNR